MSRRDVKAAVRAQRRELKARLRAQRSELRAARRAADAPARRRRSRRRLFLLVVLLLLLLLRECSCVEGPPPPVTPSAPPAPVVKAPPPPVPAPPPPIRKRVRRRRRPAYVGTPARKKTWLDAFRIQVAARSPKLSACFEGVDRPGAVKWAAAVNPKAGTVSDQSLEPLGESVTLTKRQQDCLQRVLSEPPFSLGVDEEDQSTPERVGLVLEF